MLTAKDRAAAATAAIAAAVAVAAPLTESFEGYSARVYRDPGGVPTYCYGETKDPDPTRIYARTECAAKMRKRMARDFGPPILRCVPGFIEPRRRKAFAASIDAAYNAGPAGFCRSPMAQAFRAGRWAQGCAAFRGWYVTQRIRGVPTRLRGLVKRRDMEAKLCAGAL